MTILNDNISIRGTLMFLALSLACKRSAKMPWSWPGRKNCRFFGYRIDDVISSIPPKREAIRFASQVTRRFDFESSMVQPIERAFRAFGGRQIQYAQLSRGATLKGHLALIAHELHSARKRRSL